jgi:hypothetical protein
MIRMRYLMGVVLIATLAATAAVLAADAEKPMDNADIVKLTKLDMGDEVIIAKIKSAPAVHFATGTDELVKLKESGVSKAVIAAMLDRSAAGKAPAAPAAATSAAGASASAAGAAVTLVATDRTVALKEVDGDVKTIVAPFVGMKRFIIFPEPTAQVRTSDHKPSVTIATDKDPHKLFWLVKLDPDKEDGKVVNRSMDVESPGMWGGVLSSAPDKDNQVKCDETQDKPGVWRFTPTKELKPGEYGIYVGKGEQTGIVYDFGIDK